MGEKEPQATKHNGVLLGSDNVCRSLVVGKLYDGSPFEYVEVVMVLIFVFCRSNAERRELVNDGLMLWR